MGTFSHILLRYWPFLPRNKVCRVMLRSTRSQVFSFYKARDVIGSSQHHREFTSCVLTPWGAWVFLRVGNDSQGQWISEKWATTSQRHRRQLNALFRSRHVSLLTVSGTDDKYLFIGNGGYDQSMCWTRYIQWANKATDALLTFESGSWCLDNGHVSVETKSLLARGPYTIHPHHSHAAVPKRTQGWFYQFTPIKPAKWKRNNLSHPSLLLQVSSYISMSRRAPRPILSSDKMQPGNLLHNSPHTGTRKRSRTAKTKAALLTGVAATGLPNFGPPLRLVRLQGELKHEDSGCL